MSRPGPSLNLALKCPSCPVNVWSLRERPTGQPAREAGDAGCYLPHLLPHLSEARWRAPQSSEVGPHPGPERRPRLHPSWGWAGVLSASCGASQSPVRGQEKHAHRGLGSPLALGTPALCAPDCSSWGTAAEAVVRVWPEHTREHPECGARGRVPPPCTSPWSGPSRELRPRPAPRVKWRSSRGGSGPCA